MKRWSTTGTGVWYVTWNGMQMDRGSASSMKTVRPSHFHGFSVMPAAHLRKELSKLPCEARQSAWLFPQVCSWVFMRISPCKAKSQISNTTDIFLMASQGEKLTKTQPHKWWNSWANRLARQFAQLFPQVCGRLKVTKDHNLSDTIQFFQACILLFLNLLCLPITCGLQLLCFSLPSITAADLLGNKKGWLTRVKRSCSCIVIGRLWSTWPVSVFLWSVGCYRNYDWQQ